jgi:hypothetical protein
VWVALAHFSDNHRNSARNASRSLLPSKILNVCMVGSALTMTNFPHIGLLWPGSPELAAELAAATGTRADPASISRWLIRNGYRFKKNAAGQRTRSARRPTSARGVDGHAATEDAA